MLESLIRVLTQFGVTGGAAWLVRFIRSFTRENFSILGTLKSLLSLVFVMMVVGLIVIDYPLLPMSLKQATVAVMCFMADDILSGVSLISRMLGSDPVTLGGRVWHIIRGGKL